EGPLEPLRRGGHRGVERERDDVAGERAEPPPPPRGLLLRHRGGGDPRGPPPPLGLAVVAGEPNVRRGPWRRLGEARQRVERTVVVLARVRLPGDEDAPLEPRAAGEGTVELLDAVRVAVEEREERGLGPGRALDAQEPKRCARRPDDLEVEE